MAGPPHLQCPARAASHTTHPTDHNKPRRHPTPTPKRTTQHQHAHAPHGTARPQPNSRMRQGLECAHGKRGGKLPDSSPSCIPRPAQRWREESARCPRRRRTKRSGGALAPAFGVGAPCAADTHGISQRENAQGKQRGSSHRSRGASHVAEDCWPGRRGGGARGQAGRRGPRAVECRLFRPAITPRGAVGPARPRATARSPRAERLARTAKRVEFETAGKSLFNDASPGGGTVSSSQRSNRNR